MTHAQVKAPLFDDDGNNLADPGDRTGRKSEYIQILHERAIQLHLRPSKGYALDIGCGLGRMGKALCELGYDVIGLDPSLRVLKSIPEKSRYAGIVNAALPQLPFRDESFDLVCLFGVARMVHLLGKAKICGDAIKFVKPGGHLAVIENIRTGDNRYLQEPWFEEIFSRGGLSLMIKIPIRASRWPVIYLIRYGLIPKSWFPAIVEWELSRMAKKKAPPRLSYHNYLFIYKK